MNKVNESPNRAATHRAVPFDRLANLGMEVEEAADGDTLHMEALLKLAAEQGKPASHYVAASVLSADIQLEHTHAVALVFCAGVCQQWGALECIDHAVESWEKRRDAKLPLFDIQGRKCLDRCADAAVLEVRSPSGTAVITAATPEKIDLALEALLSQ